ncbi:MAG TPA: acyl-phosphate glycerol 3-phosphate acyltransferase [Spirochaetia bacterium]|nr:acyl-phosphate glycerol 3-phosphate acyltransferase [Spirochaetia bacterium]
MSNAFYLILLFCSAYLIGSLPFSYLIAKSCGVNLFKAGSGNIGATNVMRSCGKLPGILAYLLDIFKGFAAVKICLFLSDFFGFISAGWYLAAQVAPFSAIIGHMFPIFLKLKGGKGVAVSAGIFFAYVTLPMTAVFIIFLSVVFITGYVSLGSITAAALLPGFVFLHDLLAEKFFLFDRLRTGLQASHFLAVLSFCSLISVLIIIKHRSNINRLLNGTENSFKKKT